MSSPVQQEYETIQPKVGKKRLLQFTELNIFYNLSSRL